MQYKLAVIGNPINHSLSPIIFKLFAKITNINLTYSKILANDKNDFKNKVAQFFQNNGYMLNITSPFKHEAYLLAKHSSDISRKSQTANTLYLKNNQLYADTTDGRGLCKDLIINNIELLHKNILIIGSGFVVESIIPDIMDYNLNALDILARNYNRVNYIINKYNINLYNKQVKYDIIINTTPNIENNNLFREIINNINSNSIIYDITYNNTNNYLQNLLKINHLNLLYLNGIGMLLEQARINFINLFHTTPNLTINKLKKFI
jgi:shikimate dehydrogenase